MLRVCHLWVTCGVSVDWTCSSLYPADASSDWKWGVCRLGEGLRLFIMYKPFLSSFCALPCWGWLMPLGILLPRVVCLIRNNVAGGWYLSILSYLSYLSTMFCYCHPWQPAVLFWCCISGPVWPSWRPQTHTRQKNVNKLAMLLW